MYLKDEFEKGVYALSELIFWHQLLNDGLLYSQDGSISATWRFTGDDMASKSLLERRGYCSLLAQQLNLGSRWMIETNAMRRQVTRYLPPAQHDIHPVAKILDHERRLQWEQPRTFYETERFITLTYLPPMLREHRFTRWISGKNKPITENELENALELHERKFLTVAADFEASVRNLFGSCQRLKARKTDTFIDDELLRFLYECVFSEDAPFPLPDPPIYLNHLFRGRLVPADEPILNDKFVRVLAIDSYPAGSLPGIFQALETMEFPYRLHTRMMLLDPDESAKMHIKNMKAWRGQERSMTAQIFNVKTSRVNRDASNMVVDSEDAETAARRAIVHWGSYCCKIIMQADTLEELEDWTAVATETIKPTGFRIRIETDNSMEAWRGSWPVHGYSDVRMVLVDTNNLADMMPLNTPWTGTALNPSPHLKGQPALGMAASDGNTPIYFNIHTGKLLTEPGQKGSQGERFHSWFVGPTRAGKSFCLSWIIWNWMARYPDAQVFTFDRRAAQMPLTLALDGHYYPFGTEGDQLKLTPFFDLERDSDKAWAAGYIEQLAYLTGVNVKPEHRETISQAVNRLALRPRERRSFSDLLVLLQQPELQSALKFFQTGNAATGGMLDGRTDSVFRLMSSARVHCFEMQALINNPDKKLLRAVLPCLFHQIHRRLDGRPTLIPIDEAWMVFSDAEFSAILASWLRALAALNAGVILLTQNMDDIVGKPLQSIVVNQCATKIYLPNSNAKYGDYAYYREMGLNDTQIDRVAFGTPAWDYFMQSEHGFNRFHLHPGETMKAFCGMNSEGDRNRLTALRAERPNGWQAEWLRQCGQPDWADELQREMRLRDHEADGTTENSVTVCA